MNKDLFFNSVKDSGKRRIVNIGENFVPVDEKIITIEDSFELTDDLYEINLEEKPNQEEKE